MANIFLDAYHNSFQDDEEERRRRQQEQQEQSTSNIFLDSYKKQFPKKAVAKEVDQQTPSQIAAEEQQQPKEEEKKRSVFDRVKETAESFVAGTKGLGKRIFGGSVGLAPKAIEQTTSLKPLAIDNQIATLKYGIDVVEKDIKDGTQTKIKLFGGTEAVKLTPEQLNEKEKSLDDLQRRLARLEATKAEREGRETISKKGRELALKGGEEAQEARQEVQKKYGTPEAWSGQWVLNEVAYNTPQFLASFGLGVATGVVTKNPKVALAMGFSTSFGLEASGAYEEAVRSGVDDSTAQKIGANTGVINAMIEQVPLGRILNKSPAGKTIKKNVLNRVTSLLIERAKDGVFEGGTEAVQEIVGNAFAQEYDENRGLFDGIKEAGFIGMVLGVIGGGIAERGGNVNVVNQSAVELTNKAVEEAYATPPESRTPEQEELLNSLGEMEEAAPKPEEAAEAPAPVETKEEPEEDLTLEEAIARDKQNLRQDVDETLKALNVEVTEVSHAVENIREYMQTQGDTSQTGFISKSISDRTINYLQDNPVGVDELNYDADGNITLYRSGNAVENAPNSYSLEKGDNQEAFTINRSEVLINTNSQRLRNMVSEIYKEVVDKNGVPMSEGVIRSLDEWNSLESEVIAIPGEIRQAGREAKVSKGAEPTQKPKKITKTTQKKAKPTQPAPAKPKPKKAQAAAPKVYGRGQKRVSKLGVGVETKAIEQELTQGFQDIPEYRQMNVKNQIARAKKLLAENPESAIAVALGQEQPKFGLAPEAVFKVVEDKALADGSVDLLRQLATSVRVDEATTMGQRIRLLAERNPDSAVNKMMELVDARKKAIEKAKGYNVDKEVGKLKKEVDKQVKKITKGDWKSFIDSIEC